MNEPQEPPYVVEDMLNASNVITEPGKEFLLSYEVTNYGDSFSIHHMPFILNGETLNSKYISLYSGETKKVDMILFFNDKGEHLVEIGESKVNIIVREPPSASFFHVR